jgi:hypothetical protein
MALARLSESRQTDAFSVAVWELGHSCAKQAATAKPTGLPMTSLSAHSPRHGRATPASNTIAILYLYLMAFPPVVRFQFKTMASLNSGKKAPPLHGVQPKRSSRRHGAHAVAIASDPFTLGAPATSRR